MKFIDIQAKGRGYKLTTKNTIQTIDKFLIAPIMINYGGGFLSKLGHALIDADDINTKILLESFEHCIIPEIEKYLEKYPEWGEEQRSLVGDWL